MSGTRRNALIAGISLLVMAVAAGFSYGYVFGSVIVEGDPAATYSQIVSREALYFAGLAGWIVIFLTDLIVAWSLYLFFREVNRRLSLTTALVRVAYTAFLGLALVQLFRVIPVIHGNGSAEAAGEEVLSLAGSFARTWSVGLMIFGIHLLGLGRLTMRAISMPRWLGLWLIFAGGFYFLLNFARSVIPGSENAVTNVERILAVPLALAELLLAFWLLFRGGRNRA